MFVLCTEIKYSLNNAKISKQNHFQNRTYGIRGLPFSNVCTLPFKMCGYKCVAIYPVQN